MGRRWPPFWLRHEWSSHRCAREDSRRERSHADHNRSDFRAAGVRVINLMSSPGAGKTTLLRETLLRLRGTLRIGIVEGDIETSIDADRRRSIGGARSTRVVGEHRQRLRR